MTRIVPVSLLVAFTVAINAIGPSAASRSFAQPQGDSSESQRVTDRLRDGATALEPLVRADIAKEFLAATSKLPEPSTRTIYRNREKGLAISKREHDALPAAEQAAFTARECTPEFYYETGYGSPLVFVRLLDLASPHLVRGPRPKLLDFGYGTIGQLHLLAHCGFDAQGVDVEPVFPALYSEPGDTGAIGSGSVAIHKGQWPAEESLRTAIGGGYTLITSKNTLKNGYIHPTPPAGQTVDPKKLVHLGVSDEEFLARVHDALVPGGVFLIYNICPPQNPPEKEYIPWADGTSPFSREMYEKAGFDVISFDVRDDGWVVDCFGKLGYTAGKTREEAAKEFLCWYTILRRKPGA